METDPLQQLRDIHLPAEPAWWPPAIGWWLLAIIAILAVAWLIKNLLTAWRKRAPIRAARKHYKIVHAAYSNNETHALDYCHQCNELLKRLLVHGLGRQHLGAQVDDDWLASLDRIVDDESFSQGAGRVLGAERFRREPDVDGTGLHRAMTKLLKKVNP